jgi:uncharacterized protein YndB with AHSA1/START domain
MSRSIERTVVYEHPVERVWRALTDRGALAQWLMPNDFEPRIGHRFKFRTDPQPGFDGIVDCEVLELEPPRTLAITWRGGPIDTVVRWTLEPLEANRTRMRFEQSGFEGAEGLRVSRILLGGFDRMYGDRLPQVLGRMALQETR